MGGSAVTDVLTVRIVPRSKFKYVVYVTPGKFAGSIASMKLVGIRLTLKGAERCAEKYIKNRVAEAKKRKRSLEQTQHYYIEL